MALEVQANNTIPPQSIIVAFYANPNYGSDWRVGSEYIKFAADYGFELAIIATLDRNAKDSDLIPVDVPMRVLRVPWFWNNSAFLYKLSDFLPQIFWHFRVMKTIKKKYGKVNCIWISTSSAQPWFPLSGYIKLADQVVWGPVGGGGYPSKTVFSCLNFRTKAREIFRSVVEKSMFIRKVKLIKSQQEKDIVILTRTRQVQERLKKALGRPDIPLFPEFLHILSSSIHLVNGTKKLRFLWVGRDIPRKNLELALAVFRKLRDEYFPEAQLDIYGCSKSSSEKGVIYYGWVSKIDWALYTGRGVLLLSSYREGLSTVLIEAISNGLLCIATPVGAIPSFKLPNVLLLDQADYTALSSGCIKNLAIGIENFLKQEIIELPEVTFVQELEDYLQSKNVLSIKRNSEKIN